MAVSQKVARVNDFVVIISRILGAEWSIEYNMDFGRGISVNCITQNTAKTSLVVLCCVVFDNKGNTEMYALAVENKS